MVFCDLRGFTAFAEIAEPEEVMRGPAPVPRVPGPSFTRTRARSSASSATASMCSSTTPALPRPGAAGGAHGSSRCAARIGELARSWRRHGHDLGFGVGIAQGYATLGRIGFEGRFDYAAIGTVPTSPRACATRPLTARSSSMGRSRQRWRILR
jgi:adenylate cyclase